MRSCSLKGIVGRLKSNIELNFKRNTIVDVPKLYFLTSEKYILLIKLFG